MSEVECFLRQTVKEAIEFEENTHDCSSVNKPKVDIEEEEENDENDLEALEEQFEALPIPQNDCNSRTTMFFNNYSEDTDTPSIANRLAEAIVQFEIENSVHLDNEDDFIIDNEMITEEEYFKDKNHQSEVSTELHKHDVEEVLSGKEQVDEFDNDLELYSQPNKEQIALLADKAKTFAKKVQEKVCVAPGEHGSFKNWGEDVYIEEKAFPHLFPYGCGGYLSSCLDDADNSIGFANYCKSQLLSCDDKFRKDDCYIFFILLVKELILLKRCISTYLRQATRLSNLTRDDVLHTKNSDLVRYNRCFQVFKSLRGTASYFEESKKNLFAMLRQHGCPTLFLTLNSNEFDWPGLLREILETELRRRVSDDEIDCLSNSEKNRIIARNSVQSTVHFQKRIEKMYKLMEKDFFVTNDNVYHVHVYFYRIEYQQRGAPHCHSLLWLRDQQNKDAPSLLVQEDVLQTGNLNNDNKKKIEDFADMLITTSPDDISCEEHENELELHPQCSQCDDLFDRVSKYQSHSHTFTCEKKRKTMTIKENEGHGRLDGIISKEVLENLSICRFSYPKFPMDKTTVIMGISKDEDENIVKERKNDLKKITKYLIRQTSFKDTKYEEFERFMELDFWSFLFEAGMFKENKPLSKVDESEKKIAKDRYLNAISASVKGTAVLVLQREVKNIFVNAYNPKIMRLHKTNIDIQIVVDPYGAAQYCSSYMTKNESGKSKLMKTVNDETKNLSDLDKLRSLASVLDKHREVSIQEATYRVLGLNMTRSSVKVKFLSTLHPNYRDGLLKGNLENLEDNESIFHNSPHDYYQSRPEKSDIVNVLYEEEELESEYWDSLSLAEFWSMYEIVYGKHVVPKESKKSTLIPLKDGKGFIRRRKEPAVLRYYLNFGNDEDLARGLLILFKPYRNEMEEIHRSDVKALLFENCDIVAEKREKFEKYQTMLDLISSIQSEIEDDIDKEDEDEQIEEGVEIESTAEEDIKEFNQWAKDCASKDLAKFKNLTNICDIEDFRKNISSLTKEQRRLFDDFVERIVSTDIDEKPFYLFISGNAGTGKSYLVRLMIEAVKLLNIKAGVELQKPPVIVCAPTANAACIIGGKTIDSALGFYPTERNRYCKADSNKMAMMNFQYEDVKTLFVDEIRHEISENQLQTSRFGRRR